MGGTLFCALMTDFSYFCTVVLFNISLARVVELVYTYVSEAYASRLASSSLASGTDKQKSQSACFDFFCFWSASYWHEGAEKTKTAYGFSFSVFSASRKSPPRATSPRVQLKSLLERGAFCFTRRHSLFVCQLAILLLFFACTILYNSPQMFILSYQRAALADFIGSSLPAK